MDASLTDRVAGLGDHIAELKDEADQREADRTRLQAMFDGIKRTADTDHRGFGAQLEQFGGQLDQFDTASRHLAEGLLGVLQELSGDVIQGRIAQLTGAQTELLRQIQAERAQLENIRARISDSVADQAHQTDRLAREVDKLTSPPPTPTHPKGTARRRPPSDDDMSDEE